ncbi:uncharacterized protein BKCO1_1000603 [Diplodia corticola]|uniref:Uncharacterized protein n=1 Tax=Diplodia corticola TaxID=236234 RepID=A0A1J9RKX3_9PEZI|nr:uncharacterized protein BKCO1_1000603 [Diplodia corticola]OJD40618.1 hypothetical protein BKCO1_1000603 [Diplodia corticola]
MQVGNQHIRPSVQDHWNLLLDTCGIFFSVVRLGMLSFTGSHTSNFDEMIFGSTEELEVIRVSAFICLHKRDLACLQEYVGGAAWVFGPNQLERGAYHVSIDMKTFSDLWGPLWACSESEHPPGFQEMYTEGGVIRPHPDDTSTYRSEDELRCHWEPLSTLEIRARMRGSQCSPRTASADYRIGSRKMLIGAGEHVSEQIQTETRSEPSIPTNVLPHFKDNEKCPMSHSFLCSRRQMRVPGTYGSTYEPDSYAVNAATGYKFTIGGAKGWKRRPAKSLKERLLTILSGMKGKIIPLLKANVGLEISRCSINARRVTLWDALTIAHAGKKIASSGAGDQLSLPHFCTHFIGQIACIAECWNLAGALSRAGVSFKEDTLIDVAPGDSSEASESKSKVRELVVDAVAELEQTGVDQTDVLQAFYPYVEAPTAVCLDIKSKNMNESNNWISMVKESPSTACFAVMSDSCLVSPLTGSSLNPNYGRCLMDPAFSQKKRCSLLQTVLYRSNSEKSGKLSAQSERRKSTRGLPYGEDLFLENVGTLKPVNRSGLVFELSCKPWNLFLKGHTEVKELMFDEHGTDLRGTYFIV